MKNSIFKKFIMIILAAVLAFTMVTGCGKKKEVNNEPATTKADAVKETDGGNDNTEEPTEEELPIGHVREGDRLWLDSTLYTDKERETMQFTVDGVTYGYDDFLEMTNNDFACWRYNYQLELDNLECTICYANVDDSEKTDLWNNTIYPKLQNEEELAKIRKQIREDAIAMVAGLAQDDNGLISKGKTAGYSAYAFDGTSNKGVPLITDENAIEADVKGIVANARCTAIMFNPNVADGFVTADVAFTFVTTDPLGEAYDIEAHIPISFVYIENEDKWMAFSIGEAKGNYVVYEKDGEFNSYVLLLDEESRIEPDYIVIEGPGYDTKSSARTALNGHFGSGDHFSYFDPWAGMIVDETE